MQGKTHIAVGMTSALLVSHPTTIHGVVTAMVSGAIGGWIVDIDCKRIAIDREKIYNAIINTLAVGIFLTLDYFMGKGIYQYISDNWGLKIWGGLLGFLLLIIIGFHTNHRTFTHSLLGTLLFSSTVYLFCQPASLPFMIGYISHLILDFVNIQKIPLFFPLKWKLSLGLCESGNRKVNNILFLIAFASNIAIGAFLFVSAMLKNQDSAAFVSLLRSAELFGLNALQIYLVFINLITFLGFQRSWKQFCDEDFDETDYSIRWKLEFETWLLNILVFIGGGVGMFFSLLIHLQYPAKYNGIWCAFCYTSILFWFTIYCYVCDPFGWILNDIALTSIKHIPLFLYLLGINSFSALAFFAVKGKKFHENSFRHTLLWLLGALGGTVGAISVVIITHRTKRYDYACIGFSIMLISQIIFIIYLMATRVL